MLSQQYAVPTEKLNATYDFQSVFQINVMQNLNKDIPIEKCKHL